MREKFNSLFLSSSSQSDRNNSYNYPTQQKTRIKAIESGTPNKIQNRPYVPTNTVHFTSHPHMIGNSTHQQAHRHYEQQYVNQSQ